MNGRNDVLCTCGEGHCGFGTWGGFNVLCFIYLMRCDNMSRNFLF